MTNPEVISKLREGHSLFYREGEKFSDVYSAIARYFEKEGLCLVYKKDNVADEIDELKDTLIREEQKIFAQNAEIHSKSEDIKRLYSALEKIAALPDKAAAKIAFEAISYIEPS